MTSLSTDSEIGTYVKTVSVTTDNLSKGQVKVTFIANEKTNAPEIIRSYLNASGVDALDVKLERGTGQAVVSGVLGGNGQSARTSAVNLLTGLEGIIFDRIAETSKVQKQIGLTDKDSDIWKGRAEQISSAAASQKLVAARG